MKTKYFKELDNLDKMDKTFLLRLDEARERAGIPFVINSAYRAPEHNAKIGGKPNSSHLKGLAVDISVTNSRQRFIVLNALLEVGFTRIGIADTFIHVDLSTDKSQQVIWTY
jgi:zinc D-Ala-D-Ala carboxypeptidase